MIKVTLDTSTLANVRFEASPLQETLSWLQLTLDGREHPAFGDPGPVPRRAVSTGPTQLVADLVAVAKRSHYLPDFLTPHLAANSIPSMDEQLAAIENVDPWAAVTQVLRLDFGPDGPSRAIKRALDNGTIGAQASRGIRHFWLDTLHDEWSPLQTCIDAECGRVADIVSSSGLGTSFTSLHADITWGSDSLMIALPHHDEHAYLTNTDLAVVPTVLGDQVMVQACTGEHAHLTYPIVLAPSSGGRPSSSELMGRSRAALLDALERPSTTQQLARELKLSPATTSYHLQVLHRAGLVSRERAGHYVRYRRC